MPVIKLRQQNKLGNHFLGFGYYKKKYSTLPVRLKDSYLYWSLRSWVGNIILTFVLLSDEAFSWTLRSPANVAVLGAGIPHRLTKSIPDLGVRISWNTPWQPATAETKSHLGPCLTDRSTTAGRLGEGGCGLLPLSWQWLALKQHPNLRPIPNSPTSVSSYTHSGWLTLMPPHPRQSLHLSACHHLPWANAGFHCSHAPFVIPFFSLALPISIVLEKW